MKRILYLFILCLSYSTTSLAQTYSDDIAEIIYDNCAICHHTGGIAPFSLMNYTEVSSLATAIQTSVNNKNMPPWPPNPDYREFAHQRVLDQNEIDLINDWVTAGTPEGNAANTPAAPVFNEGSFLGEPDLKLTIPTYTSKATFGSDDYVCFALPSGLTQDRYIKAIEVVPGNPQIVHHVLVHKMSGGTYSTDTSGLCTGPNSGLIAGYAPGEFPMIYPNDDDNKLGVKLSAGDDLVLAMHYPEGSLGEVDSTSVNIFFYDDTTANVREVEANAGISDFSFCLSPNTVDTLYSRFPPASFGALPFDVSVLSIFPHCHLLGKSFNVFAVTGAGDTIPMVDIPEWDFEWQGFYLYKNVLKIPAGSVIHAYGVYDNTANNINNPFNPPQTVCAGLNTTDEMFLVYFHYMVYQPGDENIDLEGSTTPPQDTVTTSVWQEQHPYFDAPKDFKVYPNPSRGQTVFDYALEKEEEVNLRIYDLRGRLVHEQAMGTLPTGQHQLIWDATNLQGQIVPNGVYLTYLRAGDALGTRKIIINRK